MSAAPWSPPPDELAGIGIGRLVDWLSAEQGLDFSDCASLWPRSTDNLAAFWSAVWAYFEISANGPDNVSTATSIGNATWFVGAALGYAQQELRRSGSATAILALCQSREPVDDRGTSSSRRPRQRVPDRARSSLLRCPTSRPHRGWKPIARATVKPTAFQRSERIDERGGVDAELRDGDAEVQQVASFRSMECSPLCMPTSTPSRNARHVQISSVGVRRLRRHPDETDGSPAP
jgi:hypothetical protein